MSFISLYTSLEYNDIDKSMRVNKDAFPETMPEWLKVFALVTGTITGIPLVYFFPWLYSIACIIGLFLCLYNATGDFVIQYGPIGVPPILSKCLKVFMSVIGTTFDMVGISHIYRPRVGLFVIAGFVILLCIIDIIQKSVASIEVFSEFVLSISSIVVVCGLLSSPFPSVWITVKIFKWIHTLYVCMIQTLM